MHACNLTIPVIYTTHVYLFLYSLWCIHTSAVWTQITLTAHTLIQTQHKRHLLKDNHTVTRCWEKSKPNDPSLNICVSAHKRMETHTCTRHRSTCHQLWVSMRYCLMNNKQTDRSHLDQMNSWDKGSILQLIIILISVSLITHLSLNPIHCL